MAPSRLILVLALVALATLAFASDDAADSTTVVDLDAQLGRRGGRRTIRRFRRGRGMSSSGGGMSTSGFFQMMPFQGNHEEGHEESMQQNELGEPQLGEGLDT